MVQGLQYYSKGYPFQSRLFINPSDVEHLSQIDSDIIEHLCVPFAPNITLLSDSNNRGNDKGNTNQDETRNCDSYQSSYPSTNVFDIRIVRISSTVSFVSFVINEEVTWDLVSIANRVHVLVTIWS